MQGGKAYHSVEEVVQCSTEKRDPLLSFLVEVVTLVCGKLK